MSRSTETAGAQHAFAAEVLRNLLRRIAEKNIDGRYTYLVSYAWTDGPMLYLVYTAPPSDITWGLVRDTSESLTDPGPWPDADEAALYYYLLDLEGIQPSASTQHSGEPGTILWLGDRHEGLPEHPSEIADVSRCMPSTAPSSTHPEAQGHTNVTEPRRYANPQ